VNKPLDNLTKIGQLKKEPSTDMELHRLLDMARKHLSDAANAGNSVEGRFLAAYAAAHSAALAALRSLGYRSENRYTVFQTLEHTLQWPAERWRQLDHAHRLRNLAEYEGYLEVEERQVQELIELVAQLLADAQAKISH
jgi:hypothetical protein